MASRPDQTRVALQEGPLELELLEPEKWRLTIAARRAKAKELIATGMSIRDAAAALGVSKSTVHDDVSGNRTKGVQEPDLVIDRGARSAAILDSEALAPVSAQVRPLVDEGGVVRKLSMVAACQALLVEIRKDPAAVAAALGRARHTRVF
jgi:predicted transcriptional regulator